MGDFTGLGINRLRTYVSNLVGESKEIKEKGKRRSSSRAKVIRILL